LLDLIDLLMFFTCFLGRVMNDLEGQVALITGGGGDIGTGIATELAQHGADIAVADVDSLESEHNQAGSSNIGGYESSQSVIDKIEEHQ
jgi:meso-butanediol dehydrogenase / (S,S)-butanediol dehydrogenase / diacetyl reductase